MGDMSLPADYPTVPVSMYDEAKLVKLARQIAMGIKDLPDILFDNGMTLMEFNSIKQNPHFCQLLESEIKSWESAGNTQDRVRIKAGALLEEYLPELYARLNDRQEPLMGKIKALEHLSRMAGFGDRDIPQIGTPGDRVHVVINLGADSKLVYDKQLPPKVIDHAPTTHQPLEQSFEESIDASPHPV